MSIQSQVEQIQRFALAHARLALLEGDVAEAERLTGQPFRRGRTIIEQTRARLEREHAALAGMSA
jgi:FAD synthase